jgi:undecaprenyl-diphosphatase
MKKDNLMDTWRINFRSATGYYCRYIAALIKAANSLRYLTKQIYSNFLVKLEDFHPYYLIWKDICMGWFAKKGILKSNKAKWMFIFLTTVLFLPASYFIYMEEQGNFHAITQGEAYRSAQLDRDELRHCIHKYNIKSIINLRGKRRGRRWYREELRVSNQLNCRHYDLSIPADKNPSPAQVKKLLHLFETATRPVLLHCKAGADRTGLAAALWKAAVDSEPKALAKKQLSLRFGHIPIGPTSALDDFFKKWRPQKNLIEKIHPNFMPDPLSSDCERIKGVNT